MELFQETFLQLLHPYIILIIFSGVSAGLFVGAMPGLTATMALAVLLPFTFTMPPLHGLVALGAVYMGAIYGGSFAAILVNTPGTPSSIATAFEGYPMAKSGRAIEAIYVATISSAIGGIAGVLFLLLLSPPLARLSLRFGPAEYFWVAMLGLTLIASLSEGSLLKGLLGGALGMILGTIGVSPIGGETRFTFGLPVLQGGVAMIVALIGIFVLPELYNMASQGRAALQEVSIASRKQDSFWQVIKRVLSMPGNLTRSCIIGEIVAIIPGAGGNIANLVAYSEAKRASKHPERFGTGTIEGLVASESSNNVTVAGSMVPLLTLGVPGAPPDAVILGVLLLHGLRPGIEWINHFHGPGSFGHGACGAPGRPAHLSGNIQDPLLLPGSHHLSGHHPGHLCPQEQHHRCLYHDDFGYHGILVQAGWSGPGAYRARPYSGKYR